MRYMVFVKMAEDVGQPPNALVEAMGADMSRAFADGWMIDAGGLYPPSQSTEIRLRGGEITSVDGPYAEAKEVIGGYSVIEVRSDGEALAAARRVLELHQEHWTGWEGSVEVRRLAEDRGVVRRAGAAHPEPPFEVNRAVAHGRVHGPEAGLAVLDAVGPGALGGSHLLPAVRGDLPARSGRREEAAAAFLRAAELTRNEGERAVLRGRADELH